MRDQSLKTLTENVFVLSLLWWIWGSSRKSLLSRPWSHRSLVSLSLTTAVVKFMPFLPFAWALFISLKLLRLFLCNSKYHYDVLRCGHLKFALLGPRQSLSLRVDLTQLMWSSPLLGSFWWIVGATKEVWHGEGWPLPHNYPAGHNERRLPIVSHMGRYSLNKSALTTGTKQFRQRSL